MDASQGLECLDFNYSGYHFKNDQRRARALATCLWIALHNPDEPGWALFLFESLSPGLTGTICKYSKDMRELAKELWKAQLQDDAKVDQLVAKMNEVFGELPRDLTSMLNLLEPCSPKYEVLRYEEMRTTFMLPDRIEQESQVQNIENDQFLDGELRATPRKIQELFQLYQENLSPQDQQKTLKVKFTEFVIELYHWVACAQAAKVAKSEQDYVEKCKLEEQDGQRRIDAWNQLLKNDAIFKAALPNYNQMINDLRNQCYDEEDFQMKMKQMQSASWYVAAQFN